LKYRHACHAGNFADVMKHIALVAVLARLTEKSRPLFLLDTHAGRGRYDLASRDTAAEAARGYLKLAGAPLPAPLPACVARYLDIVERLNGGSDGRPRWYPGSPLVAMAMLRDADHAAFCELAPAEADALRRELRGDRRAGVHCRDGFEALGALLPPAEKRGLALIDPPYEEQEADVGRVADALAGAAARWPQGVLVAWYPIKQGVVAARLHRRLLDAGIRRLLAAELCVHPDDSRAGLNGSGLVIFNPPWRLDRDLREALPYLHAVLAPEGLGRTRVALLAGD
jgi:23S rRNA (adenine2030-N6)-methyltransferase